jgi:hypothetical protein
MLGKRKAFEGKSCVATAAPPPTTTVPNSPLQQQATMSVAPISSFHQPNDNAFTYFPLTRDHELLSVIELNVSRAVLTNYSIISSIDPSSCCLGLRTFQLPQSHSGSVGASVLPIPLTPTLLQQQVPHFGWIDLFPSSQLRDNLILAFVENNIDEDNLIMDLLGGIFAGMGCGPSVSEYEHKLQTDESSSIGMSHEGLCTISEESSTSDSTRRDVRMAELGIISWSDPWDINGWEITDAFARKWAFLLKGCTDVVAATNMWRHMRGDDPLLVDIAEPCQD